MRAATLADIERATGGRLGWGAPDTVVTRIATDSRQILPDDLFWALVGEKFDGHAFLPAAVAGGAVGCVVQRDHCSLAFAADPEIPTLLVPDSLHALGDFAQAYRRRFAPRVVGITGSVGKTSTKDMTAAVLATRYRTDASPGNYNNLIGVPKTLFELDDGVQVLVAEIGADRPGEIRRLTEIAEPEIGVITSISETHLARMKDLDGIAREKGDLFAGLVGNRTLAIVPCDLARLDKIVPRVRGRIEQVGEPDGLHLVQVRLDAEGCPSGTLSDGERVYPFQLSVPGRHQARNALLALAVGRELGVPVEEGIAALRGYRGYWGRLRPLARNGWTLLEDVYNSNPQSLLAALDTLEHMPGTRKLAVLGDMLDLGEHSGRVHRECGAGLALPWLAAVWTYGSESRLLLEAAEAAGRDPEHDRHFSDPMRLIDALREMIRPGDLVLIKGSRGMKMERIVEAMPA